MALPETKRASDPPSADETRPAPGPTPPKEPEAPPTTPFQGLMLAFAGTGLVLTYYQGVRPWLFRHQFQTHIPEDIATFFKGVLAFTAFGLVMWALTRRLSGRPFPRATIDAVAVTMAVLSVTAFVLVDDIRPDQYIHKWEHFHYYLGSKYSKEIGYTRLYACVAVAQSELPLQKTEALERRIRNLETNALEPSSVAVEAPEECKSHFSEARWAAFKKDVAWFRSEVARPFWEGMQKDHGYNPPPVWTMSGRFVGSLFPEGASRSTMRALASIDPLLYALAFFSVWWAFGLRTCCVVLIFWGTQFPASAYFTSAAFLRQDWLLYLVLSACLLRKHYWALGGAALATSATLRVFPAVFFAGIAVVAVVHFIKHRRLARHHVRVFAGAALALFVLVSSSAILLGPNAYVEFAKHIKHHGSTPLTNNMGLPVLVQFTHAASKEEEAALHDETGAVTWPSLHLAAFKRRYPIYLALSLLVVLAFVLTVARIKTLWIAMALGGVLLATLPQLSCYYYSFFIVPVLLAKASPRAGRAALAAAGVSALVVLWPRISSAWEDRYAVQSIVFVVFALLLLYGFSPWRPRVPAPARAPRAA